MSGTKHPPVADFLVQSDEFHRKSTSIYLPLDPTQKQIRLMHILPGRYDDEVIDLTLSVVDLDDRPTYETVSYTWEDLLPTRQVKVAGVSYNVTVNQYQALRRFRAPDRTRTMWMDVICINQTDTAERTRQVEIMSRIYAAAVQTQIWLGEPQSDWYEIADAEWEARVNNINTDPEKVLLMRRCADRRSPEVVPRFLEIVRTGSRWISEGAVHVLQLLQGGFDPMSLPYSYLDESGCLVHCRPFHTIFKMISALFLRSWWDRVWILQEVLLSALIPIVNFGEEQLDFNTLVRSYKKLQDYRSDQSLEYVLLDDVFNLETVLNNSTHQTVFTSGLEKLANKFGHLTLPTALYLAEGRKATDKRDLIYALQSLVRKEDRLPIDYELDSSAVFGRAAWQLYTCYSPGLNRLKNAIGLQADDIPTWALNMSTPRYDGFDDPGLFDSFVSSAAETRYYPLHGMLEVFAVELDTILHVTKTLHDPDIDSDGMFIAQMESWERQLKGLGFFTEDKTRRGYQLTAELILIAFRGCTSDTAGRVQWHRSLDFWEQIARRFDELNQRVIAGQIEDETTISPLSRDFCVRMEGSALCVTESGDLCMAVDDAKPGDCIYHVRGCGIPLVLRSSGTSLSHKQQHEIDSLREILPFHVVGNCYLEKAMNSPDIEATAGNSIHLI